MQEVRKNDEWVRCPYCRHKLFKKMVSGDALIEIKCHSCKNIVKICMMEGDEDGKKN